MAERVVEASDNLTDETIVAFRQEAGAKKRELEKAQEVARSLNGEYRSILKRAKKAGIDSGLLAENIEDARLDPEDVARRERDRHRIARATGSPWVAKFSQMGLFAETDQPQAGPPPAWAAEESGYDAGRAARNIDDNPYEPGTEQFATWRKGWNRGQAANVASMPKHQTASTGRKRGGKKADHIDEALAKLNEEPTGKPN